MQRASARTDLILFTFAAVATNKPMPAPPSTPAPLLPLPNPCNSVECEANPATDPLEQLFNTLACFCTIDWKC